MIRRSLTRIVFQKDIKNNWHSSRKSQFGYGIEISGGFGIISSTFMITRWAIGLKLPNIRLGKKPINFIYFFNTKKPKLILPWKNLPLFGA